MMQAAEAPYRVLIVGCGNIAGGFDAARTENDPPLSHAGAFSRHPGFAIAACVDPDAQRREAFARRWNVPEVHAAPEDIGEAARFDVISICSPTVFHANHLRFAIDRAPRLIFCEKPMTGEAALGRALAATCADKGILLAVNHLRRWAPRLERLGEELREGSWGAVRGLNGIYNKGVLNNGSHLVDMVQFLLGEPLELIAAGRPQWDHWDDDPTVPALLASRSGIPVQVCTADARDYALFELTVVTERGIIAIEDGGASWRVRKPVDSGDFAGYRRVERGDFEPGDLNATMTEAIGNIHAALASGAPLRSTGETALQAQDLCEAIRAAALAHDAAGDR